MQSSNFESKDEIESYYRALNTDIANKYGQNLSDDVKWYEQINKSAEYGNAIARSKKVYEIYKEMFPEDKDSQVLKFDTKPTRWDLTATDRQNEEVLEGEMKNMDEAFRSVGDSSHNNIQQSFIDFDAENKKLALKPHQDALDASKKALDKAEDELVDAQKELQRPWNKDKQEYQNQYKAARSNRSSAEKDYNLQKANYDRASKAYDESLKRSSQEKNPELLQAERNYDEIAKKLDHVRQTRQKLIDSNAKQNVPTDYAVDQLYIKDIAEYQEQLWQADDNIRRLGGQSRISDEELNTDQTGFVYNPVHSFI